MENFFKNFFHSIAKTYNVIDPKNELYRCEDFGDIPPNMPKLINLTPVDGKKAE